MCRLRAAVQRKLHGGFHWTELYLGALLALLGVLGAALLYWEWQQHKRKKDQARTAENLRFNADTAFLKRLIGQVRLIGTHGWQAIPCAAHSCRGGQAAHPRQPFLMPACTHPAEFASLHAQIVCYFLRLFILVVNAPSARHDSSVRSSCRDILLL